MVFESGLLRPQVLISECSVSILLYCLSTEVGHITANSFDVRHYRGDLLGYFISYQVPLLSLHFELWERQARIVH